MMGKLPFVGRIFWKTLVCVVVIAGVAIWAYIRFGAYQVTSADKFGAPITAVLLAYLIHLWLLPPELLGGDDPDPDPDHHLESESDDAGKEP